MSRATWSCVNVELHWTWHCFSQANQQITLPKTLCCYRTACYPAALATLLCKEPLFLGYYSTSMICKEDYRFWGSLEICYDDINRDISIAKEMIGLVHCLWLVKMNSFKLVILLHFISWKKKKDSKWCCDTTTPESIHTKDESKRGSAFAFIFGVNWPIQWM